MRADECVETDASPYEQMKRILMQSEDRPDVACIKLILDMEPSAREGSFEYILRLTRKKHTFSSTPAVYRVLWTKEKADKLTAAGKHIRAIKKYQAALRTVFYGRSKYLCAEYYNKYYITAFAPNDAFFLHLDLVSCCKEVAKNFVILGEFSEALQWLQECGVLYDCMDLYFTGDLEPKEPQVISRLKTLRYYTHRMESFLEFDRILEKLGNTGSAAYYEWQCCQLAQQRFLRDFEEVKTIERNCIYVSSLRMRHPDLGYVGSWDIDDSSLQVRGIWTKIKTTSCVLSPLGRYDCVTWIWRDKLYLFGGKIDITNKFTATVYDAWCLDLQKKVWTTFQPPPANLLYLAANVKKAVVYDNYAWFFNGHRHVLRYNLTSQTWDFVATTLRDRVWPYVADVLTDPCIELHANHIYVFGGDFDSTVHGSNIFMVLDLRTLCWRYLGGWGTSSDDKIHPKPTWPSSRRKAASWVVPSEKRFYIMYGSSDVSEIFKLHLPDLNVNDFIKHQYYPDMWSYSIVDEVWTRERMRGNYPCPRSDMAVAYHPKLNAVIAFGGLNSSVRSYVPFYTAKNPFEHSDYTFYGDTFIMDVPTRSWRQVVTRSFPIWRTQAHVHLGSSTGELYLFGGTSLKHFVNCDAVYTCSHRRALHFNDIWILNLDLPGCLFEEEKFLDRSLQFKAGKWRYCYACDRIGENFFRCQGTCEGKYIFCSVECQRAAWKEHRLIHGCRKIDKMSL